MITYAGPPDDGSCLSGRPSSGRIAGSNNRRPSRFVGTPCVAQLQLDTDVRLGVGVDRLDYTKGIEEKFLAVERLLESRPELIGRFAFVQIAEPSRDVSAGLSRPSRRGC